jgi:putative NIF3 family GTP cyclohydrolase 1 type 2
MLSAAIRRGADALITADINYHRFEEADNRILLIDGGHYETEIPIVRQIVRFLTGEGRRAGSGVRIHAATTTTNAVQYHLS